MVQLKRGLATVCEHVGLISSPHLYANEVFLTELSGGSTSTRVGVFFYTDL
jgi:hypothetical protein